MPRKKKERQELEAGFLGAEAKGRITPADIQQKEFRLSMRGYNERDVDQFLDELTEEVARLQAENRRLQEQAESRPPPQMAPDTDAVIRQARERAARIVAEAEERARRIESESGTAAASGGRTSASVVDAMRPFLSRERDFLQDLARLIQEHADELKREVRRLREGSSHEGSAEPGSVASVSSTGVASRAEPASRSMPVVPPPTPQEEQHQVTFHPPSTAGSEPEWGEWRSEAGSPSNVEEGGTSVSGAEGGLRPTAWAGSPDEGWPTSPHEPVTATSDDVPATSSSPAEVGRWTEPEPVAHPVEQNERRSPLERLVRPASSVDSATGPQAPTERDRPAPEPGATDRRAEPTDERDWRSGLGDLGGGSTTEWPSGLSEQPPDRDAYQPGSIPPNSMDTDLFRPPPRTARPPASPLEDQAFDPDGTAGFRFEERRGVADLRRPGDEGADPDPAAAEQDWNRRTEGAWGPLSGEGQFEAPREGTWERPRTEGPAAPRPEDRWESRAKDEDPADEERSLRELFWGED